MNIFDEKVDSRIQKELIDPIRQGEFNTFESIGSIPDDLYANIPDSKRISYGRYYTVKVLGQRIFEDMRSISSVAQMISGARA